MPLSQSKTWGEMGVPVGMAENTWVTWGEITHLQVVVSNIYLYFHPEICGR